MKNDEACRKGGLGGGAVGAIVLGGELKELMPKAEIHAKIGERCPGDERGGREDGLMIDRENRG